MDRCALLAGFAVLAAVAGCGTFVGNEKRSNPSDNQEE